MRICFVYDSLEPYRIGGAERWYHSLAERVGRAGNDVTYVTMKQWAPGAVGEHPTARVVAVGPWMENYGAGGARTILPPLLFGWGVFVHMMRHGRRYDVVHTCSFPFFSLLALTLARPFGGYRITVDWFEVWTRAYWDRYLGRRGWIGAAVQWLCIKAPQRAFCFSRTIEERLARQRVNGPVERLTGLYAGDGSVEARPAGEPLVVFAGRHIPEKRVPLVIEAIKLAKREIPQLRATVFGCGPDFGAALTMSQDVDYIALPGFVHRSVVLSAMSQALCLLHPTEREGYGMVVVEAAAYGTPSILVDGPDNAATELIEDGVNGFVAGAPSAAHLAEAIVRAYRAGDSLRVSTAAWYSRNAARLSIDSSLERVVASYAESPAAGRLKRPPLRAGVRAAPPALSGSRAAREPLG